MVRHWKRWVWGFTGAASLVAGCAHGPPPRELVDAREEYQRASTGVTAQERPQDVAEAWQALLAAEREYDKSHDSARTRSLAYVALRKSQLAEARAAAVVAERERALAAQTLRQTQEAQRQRAEAELQAAQQQLAEARQQRQRAEQLAAQGATQQEVARMQAEAERQRQEAERLQSDAQRQQQQQAQLGEQERQRQEEAQKRAEAEAQAQQLQQELQQERQARAEAEQRAQQQSQQMEAERQARAEAERRAALALGELKGVKVSEEARGTVVTLSGSVLFTSGGANLLPSARNRLEDVARAVQGAEGTIVIEGHTDSRGTEAYNEDLSRRRAEAVRDFLVSRGVPPDKIEARGMGEYRPIASNTSSEGRANNRRVEIILPRNVASTQRPTGTGGAGSETGQPQPQEDDTGGSGADTEQHQDGTGSTHPDEAP